MNKRRLDEFLREQLEIDQLEIQIIRDFVVQSPLHHQINETPSSDAKYVIEKINSKTDISYISVPIDYYKENSSIEMDIGESGWMVVNHLYKSCFACNPIPKPFQSRSERFSTGDMVCETCRNAMSGSVKPLVEKRKQFLNQADDSLSFVAPLEFVRQIGKDRFYNIRNIYKLRDNREAELLGDVLSGAIVCSLYNWMFLPTVLTRLEQNQSLIQLYLENLTVDSEEKINGLASLFEKLSRCNTLFITSLDFSSEEYMIRFTMSLAKAKHVKHLYLQYSSKNVNNLPFLRGQSAQKAFMEYIRAQRLHTLSVEGANPINGDELLKSFLDSGGVSFTCSSSFVKLEEVIKSSDISKLKNIRLAEKHYSNSLIEHIVRLNPELSNCLSQDKVMELIDQRHIPVTHLQALDTTVNIFPIIQNHIVQLRVPLCYATKDMMKSFFEMLQSPSLKVLTVSLPNGYYNLFEKIITGSDFKPSHIEQLTLATEEDEKMSDKELSMYILQFLSLDYFPNMEFLFCDEFSLEEHSAKTLSQGIQNQKRHVLYAKHYLKTFTCNDATNGDLLLSTLMNSKLEALHFSQMEFSMKLFAEFLTSNKYLKHISFAMTEQWVDDYDEFTLDAIMVLGSLQLNWRLLSFTCYDVDSGIGDWRGLMRRYIEEKICERNERQVHIDKLMEPILKIQSFKKLSDVIVHTSRR